MPITTDQRGRLAEEQAKQLLESKGYKILVQRYKCKLGEIDLIATDQETLVSVEVKYRRIYSDAAESISTRQRKRILNTLGYFLFEHQDLSLEYPFLRIDVVLLCQESEPIHLINAWQSQDDVYEFY